MRRTMESVAAERSVYVANFHLKIIFFIFLFCHEIVQIFLTIKVLNWKDKPSRRSGAKVQTIASLINQRPQKKTATFDTR